jgi:hypothetical protein
MGLTKDVEDDVGRVEELAQLGSVGEQRRHDHQLLDARLLAGLGEVDVALAVDLKEDDFLRMYTHGAWKHTYAYMYPWQLRPMQSHTNGYENF